MNYRKLHAIANEIEHLAEEGLEIVGEDEPIRSSLLNVKGDVSSLRNAINHDKGQQR